MPRSHQPVSRPTVLAAGSPDLTDSVALGGAVVIGGAAGVFALSDHVRVDKYKHMGLVGAGTVALGSLGVAPALAAGICLVGATAKELLYDGGLGRGTASFHDAAANVTGAMAGYALLKVAKKVSK